MCKICVKHFFKSTPSYQQQTRKVVSLSIVNARTFYEQSVYIAVCWVCLVAAGGVLGVFGWMIQYLQNKLCLLFVFLSMLSYTLGLFQEFISAFYAFILVYQLI